MRKKGRALSFYVILWQGLIDSSYDKKEEKKHTRLENRQSTSYMNKIQVALVNTDGIWKQFNFIAWIMFRMELVNNISTLFYQFKFLAPLHRKDSLS